MDSVTGVYSDTLDALTGARELMLSAQWQSALTDAEGPAAAQALLDVEHAILALSNASLSDIANDMQQNKADLTNQTNALNAAVTRVNQVQGVIDAVSALVGTVAKIVPLL
jgi:hypothetical protein